MNAVRVGDEDSTVIVDTDYPIPLPAQGEARLRVLLAGICNTDLEILLGYKSFKGILGHEFVAEIEQFHPDDFDEYSATWPLKTRVVAEINCVSFTSLSKTHSEKAHDPNRSAAGIFGRNGAFAEFICMPISNLHKVPDSIPNRIAVFVEPLAAACEILEQVHVKGTDKIAVLGSGKLGNLVAQSLSVFHPFVTVIGRSSTHFEMFERRKIKTELIGSITSFQHYDLVVDCTGSAEGIQIACRLVKSKGTIVMKTTLQPTESSSTSSVLTESVVREIRLVGSRCGPFQVALSLLETGKVDVEPLITQEFPLIHANHAIRAASERHSLKILIRP
uniref:Alcohol dehydrogenase-like N-terminal domain-containing protein n=1 Tax=Timspurckia oligopyrenoides TaxID=708627 RepID=A0A7S0ZLN5_9RHOD|mmetsp:Transcript_9973/g.17962  ORF Transcript_9973/g.17962 Transcript_9973/m.17962 type:complete len:333 (+) Transcript_9973:92-1090(+)